jgi:hypothetical protein
METPVLVLKRGRFHIKNASKNIDEKYRQQALHQILS